MNGTFSQLKKALAMLLTILMLVSVLPVSAFADTVVEAVRKDAASKVERSSDDSVMPEGEPRPEVTDEPQPDYVFPQAKVKLADILDAMHLKLGNNYRISVDTDAVKLSHKTLKRANLKEITLTATRYFDYAVLTLKKKDDVHTITIAWPSPDGPTEYITPGATPTPKPTRVPLPTGRPDDNVNTIENKTSRTISATDGATYEVRVTYPLDAGLPLKGTALLVREIKPEDEAYAAYLEQCAQTMGVPVETLTMARAFDIKIVDADDHSKILQPKGSVTVSISLPGSDLAAYGDVGVLHFDSEGKVADLTPEKMKNDVSGDTISFTTDSFSVYIIVGHEGDLVENPRVKFHFIADGAAEYGSGVYMGTPYVFKNKANDTLQNSQTSQILSDGESLELITDPANRQNNFFYGWYVVDPYVISGTTDEYGIGTSDGKLYYTWPGHPDQITFESPITITERNVAIGSTVNWSLNGVSGSGAVDAEGNVHVFLAPIFENYNFVNFMLHPKEQDVTVMSRKLIARGSSAEVDVKISDVRSTSTDPVHLIFTGWEYNAGTDQNPNWKKYQTVDYTGAEMKDPGKDGVYLTINLDDTTSVDLFPVFIEARWVDFFSGVSGSGASYVASRFRESWGTPGNPPAGMTENNSNVLTTLDVSSRIGYAFEGWYAFAVTDPTTGEITNLSTPDDITISYVDINDKFTTHSVSVNTTAVKIADSSGAICYSGSGACGIQDDNGIYRLVTDGSGEIALFGPGSTSDKLKFYDALDRLKLAANWTPQGSQITVIYWTEKEQEEGYTAPVNPKDDYTASAVKVITTGDLNAQASTIGATFTSGSTLTLAQLQLYTVNAISVLDRSYLDDVGAVLAGEEKFYDLNTSLSDASVTIKGDGSTVYNVYFERKTFKLVFHIGRDGYVKQNGQQREAFMDASAYPAYANWWNDRNWIQFMYGDSKITSAPPAGLGYTKGPTAESYSVSGQNFTMTYDGHTYTSAYVTTPENVRGDYVPGDSENVYVITAKYGAYIGDRWPTPTNPNFTFTDPANSTKTMYTWAAHYDSLYCYIAHHRSTYGNQNGNNPDINGVYNYMSAELCTNRAGDDIINSSQVHHLVAYFGNKGKEGIYKNYHIMYKAIDGTYDPGSVSLVHGADYMTYNQTTWSAAPGNGDSTKVDGYDFYEKSNTLVISNVDPQYQMGWELDGYDYVYSCYDTPHPNEHHVYFFYEPKQYTLTFNIGSTPPEDTYYYTEPLSGADQYSDLVTVPEGYRFAGWYTNAEGVGQPFDFATEKMPAQNVVLYPVLKVLQYTVKIDPNGGIIDHMMNTSQSTYFTANYGTIVGEYSIPRTFIKLSDKELDSSDPLYYTGTKYYYINVQRLGIPSEGVWGLPVNARSANYVPESDITTYYNIYYKNVVEYALTHEPDYWPGLTLLSQQEFLDAYASYPYRPVNGEHYTFMGWYQVYGNGSVASMPYNFNDPVTGPLELRALWRLDGGYYLQYNPYFYEDDGAGSVTVIAGELQQWTDPANPTNQLYADQSPTHILRAPTNTTQHWVFRGWRVVRANGTSTYQGQSYTNWEPIQFDGNGDPVYYQPGDTFIVDAALVSDSDSYGGIIHMQAYYEREAVTYRRPDVTNLILDANDSYGRGYVNTSDPTDLPALTGPGSTSINTMSELYSGHPTQILFGDIQSNLVLHLYQYATGKTFNSVTGTNFFTSDDGYLLIGFDEESDPAVKNYIPTFAPDSVAAVTRNETNKILYAMWEPMVYVTFVNTTAEPITIDLSGTGGAVSIVNEVTGEFDRESTTTHITVPARSGNTDGRVKVVLPNGAGQVLTATATNTHQRKMMSVSGSYRNANPTTPYGQGSTEIKYGQQVTYTGTLVTDAEGVIVTYTEEIDAQVLYDVNGGTWNPLSADPPYQHSTGDIYFIEATDIIHGTGEYEPEDPTRSGKVFIGWTDNADIKAHTDFSSTSPVTWGGTTITPDQGGNVLDKIRSDYLWDFSRDASDLYINEKTLYAVWSDTVTVTFDIVRTGSNLHIWDGANTPTTDVPGPYVYYRSGPSSGTITYTLAKGERVPRPSDPTTDQTNWHFVQWLLNETGRRNTPKNPSDPTIVSKTYDFLQRVVDNNVTLSTSWTETEPQIFTFTVENRVTGDPNEEFTYTIAVDQEKVFGKIGTSTSNIYGDPDRKWGSVTTTLKNNESYTIQIKVLKSTKWTPPVYSVEIDVIDRNGNLIKSGHVIYCKNNTVNSDYSGKNFSSDYKYILTIVQDAKTGYETTVGIEGRNNVTPPPAVPPPDVSYQETSDPERKFIFYSSHWGTAAQQSHFDPITNGYTENESHSLTVVFTNSGTVYPSPTGVSFRLAPFALLMATGVALMPALLPRRRREEED